MLFYSGSASWTFSRFQGKNGPLVLTLERCLMLASVQTVTRYKWVHFHISSPFYCELSTRCNLPVFNVALF